ncbi:MAG: SGNH/GDSL hydrolase family protein, partial [Mycetocola sp.]
MIRKSRPFADAGAIALTASILVTGLLLPTSAQAAPISTTASTVTTTTPVLNYVALGDSYAAGQGAAPYENACLQSPQSYPELLDDAANIALKADVTCSGATTTTVLTRQLPAVATTVRNTWSINLVTLTVGANDLGVGAISAYCIVSFTSPECQAALGKATALLTPVGPGLPSRLALRLGSVYSATALLAPRAKILVTGYPLLFQTPPPSDPTYAIITQLNTATAALNATISGTAATLARAGVNSRYVDVVPAFAGHGIGSPAPWINSTGLDIFHPTAAGYQAYAAAV